MFLSCLEPFVYALGGERYVDSVASRALSVLARRAFPAVPEKYDAWKCPFDDDPKKSIISAAHRPASSLDSQVRVS